MAQTNKLPQETAEAIGKYSSLYNNLDAPYALTDADFKIQWGNRAFKAACPSLESAGHSLESLLGAEETARNLKAGKVFHCARLTIDGHPFGVTVMPIQGNENRILVATVIVLEEAEELLDFHNMGERALAIFSGDMRLPISSTITTIKEIYKTECEDKKRYTKRIQVLEKKLQSIIENQFKLLSLAENFTHFMQISNNVIRYQQKVVNISAVLTDLCRELEETALEKKIDFMYEIPSHFVARCHIELIKNAIHHLASNAFYFSGGKTVVLKAIALERSLKVMVQDHGCGIPRENLEKVFDCFFSSNPNNGGMMYSNGLGLPIVKKDIEAVGGTVTIASNEEDGTTVTLEVPCSVSSDLFVEDNDVRSSFRDIYSDYRIQMLPVIGSPRISEL